MCTLVAALDPGGERPLVIAFNRDERLDRPAVGPGVLLDAPRVIGGRDAEAGGTWFGAAETGFLVGILNRREDKLPEAGRRSRGMLAIDLLAAGSVAGAKAALEGDRARYNPFWVVFGDARSLWLATGGGEKALAIEALAAGVHVLTSGPLPELTAVRRERVRGRLEGTFGGPFGELAARVKLALSEHDLERPVVGPCVHLPPYGTRSSTLVSLGKDGRIAHYLHAEGAPCTHDYQDFSGLFDS